MLDHSFAITVAFIAISTLLAAFLRRRQRDKCLRDFEGELVTLEETSGKLIWGRLRVESTGFELTYETIQKDTDGHEEASYILYKSEYGQIQTFARFYDDLSESEKKAREKELKRTYHPCFFRRTKRQIANAFKTIRDSIMEVVNLMMAKTKSATPTGQVLTAQDKYVSRMKSDVLGTVGTSYEPLLERHIGKHVVLEVADGDKAVEYSGVLKDYTATFIEVMDVLYSTSGKEERRADLVTPRKIGIVRHAGEIT